MPSLTHVQKAIEEMKASKKWPAHEERLNYHVVTGPEGVSAAGQGIVVLVILRGETLEVTYVYYPPSRKFKAQESVEEARRQLTAYFADEKNRSDGRAPLALHPVDFERHLKRTFAPWTPEEAICHSLLKARGLDTETMVRLLERPPGTGLTPPEPIAEQAEVSSEAAVHLLGERVVCGYCSHSSLLTYRIVAQAAKVGEVSVLNMSSHELSQTLYRFRCSQCGMKVGTLKGF